MSYRHIRSCLLTDSATIRREIEVPVDPVVCEVERPVPDRALEIVTV
jgi:hypothetical protein